jgi:hypothetical protein
MRHIGMSLVDNSLWDMAQMNYRDHSPRMLWKILADHHEEYLKIKKTERKQRRREGLVPVFVAECSVSE